MYEAEGYTADRKQLLIAYHAVFVQYYTQARALQEGGGE